VLLLVNMAVGIVTIPLEIAYFAVLDRLDKNLPRPQADDLRSAENLEGLIGLVAIPQFLSNIAIIVVFLIWLYRSYANLRSLGAQGLRFSPGWTVGYYFVPILNLFRPPQVMQETWRASDPVYVEEDSRAWREAKGSWLVGVWWAFWLISNFAGQASFRLTLAPQPGMGALKSGAVLSVIATIATLTAGTCLIFLVLGITGRQEKKLQQRKAYQEQFDDVESRY
jgi:hypothetical protein